MNVLTPETQVSMTAVNKRKAILPLKYGRFMQFGYFLLDKWCEGMDRSTVEANTTKFLDLLRVYNTVEEQTELYQVFLNNADDIGSTLKNMVRDRKKALTKNAPHKSRTKKVVDTAA